MGTLFAIWPSTRSWRGRIKLEAHFCSFIPACSCCMMSWHRVSQWGYMRPFYDYLELGMANAFIIQEKLTAQRRDGKLRPKALLEFQRAVAQMLLTHCTARTSSVSKQTASVWSVTSFHEVTMMNKPGQCRWCYIKEKADCKTCMKCKTYDFFSLHCKGLKFLQWISQFEAITVSVCNVNKDAMKKCSTSPFTSNGCCSVVA